MVAFLPSCSRYRSVFSTPSKSRKSILFFIILLCKADLSQTFYYIFYLLFVDQTFDIFCGDGAKAKFCSEDSACYCGIGIRIATGITTANNPSSKEAACQ